MMMEVHKHVSELILRDDKFEHILCTKNIGYQNDIDIGILWSEHDISPFNEAYLVGCLVGRLVVGLLEGNGVVGA
jgi:hypothetical protein